MLPWLERTDGESSKRIAGRQTLGQRHVPQTSSFRRAGLPLPHGPLDTELPFLQVDVTPFERCDRTTSQTSLSPEKHPEIRLVIPPQCDGPSSPQAEWSTLDVVENQRLALSTYPGPGVLRPPEPICGIGLHHGWQLGPLKEVDRRPPAQENHGRRV